MNTITCTECGKEIEISEALTKDIEKTVIAAEHERHKVELEKAKKETAVLAKKEAEAELALEKKKYESERESNKKEAAAEIEIAKKRLESESAAQLRKITTDQELEVKTLQEEAKAEKESNKELREQQSNLIKELREQRKANENAELEMQKKLATEESKIREEATKSADDKYRLKLAENEKKLLDTQKALDEAQRKAAQGSQQGQGEVLELDIENLLSEAFRDDEIEPIAKGVKGSDIRQTVKSPRGTACGVILWECKSHKNWKDEWLDTIKENLRSAKANIPIIVTNVLPKHIAEDIGNVGGVWVCKPKIAIVLGALLRKSLLDVGLQKAITQNRDTKADALFNFVTSHEFVQQVEAMIETYQEMREQVGRERTAYEKFWSQREKQAERLLSGTANIIGSMQGQIGHTAMPRIKGLDLLESGEPEDNQST